MIKDLCRFGSSMTKQHWKLWTILVFLGLLILTLITRCGSIENDLQQRSQALLTKHDLSWAKIVSDDGGGRNLLLTGFAPNEASKNKAIELVQNVYGVATLNHDITVKEYVPSSFKVRHSDNQVIISGSLPDQSSINIAITKAQSLYGDNHVVNELTVNEMALKPSWLTAATGFMAALYGADNLALDVSDSHVNIAGTVATEEAKTQLLEQARASFDEEFTEAIQVIKMPPTAEELAAIETIRLAEKQRLAEEAETARLAEEKRLALAAEATRIAEEQRLAIEVAKKQRLATEAEMAKLRQVAAQAEQQRVAAEKKAAQLLEEIRLTQIAETNRLAELQRQTEEAARIAEEKRFIVEAEAARIAYTKQLAEQNRRMLDDCQLKLNHLINNNPSPFMKGSSVIRGSSYGLLGMITVHVNSCSSLLHKNKQFIYVASQASETENNLKSPDLGYARSRAIVSYLENINGIHSGLLRPSEQPSSEAINKPQIYLKIAE